MLSDYIMAFIREKQIKNRKDDRYFEQILLEFIHINTKKNYNDIFYALNSCYILTHYIIKMHIMFAIKS